MLSVCNLLISGALVAAERDSPFPASLPLWLVEFCGHTATPSLNVPLFLRAWQNKPLFPTSQRPSGRSYDLIACFPPKYIVFLYAYSKPGDFFPPPIGEGCPRRLHKRPGCCFLSLKCVTKGKMWWPPDVFVSVVLLRALTLSD